MKETNRKVSKVDKTMGQYQNQTKIMTEFVTADILEYKNILRYLA